MKTAICPFSGDPITLGHEDIITRASKTFDTVIAAIGNNPMKQYMFSIEDRVAMAKKALAGIKNVRVAYYEGLLADFARSECTNIIIRGIRNTEDFEYEWILHEINDSIDNTLETYWIPANKSLGLVSSSAVKAKWSRGEDISGLVSSSVLDYFKLAKA